MHRSSLTQDLPVVPSPIPGGPLWTLIQCEDLPHSLAHPLGSRHRPPPSLARDDVVVFGAIVRIEDTTTGGELVVNALIDGRGQRTVFVPLEPHAHAHAQRVHRHPGTLVRCHGRLIPAGSALRLVHPHDLELFEPTRAALGHRGTAALP